MSGVGESRQKNPQMTPPPDDKTHRQRWKRCLPMRKPRLDLSRGFFVSRQVRERRTNSPRNSGGEKIDKGGDASRGRESFSPLKNPASMDRGTGGEKDSRPPPSPVAAGFFGAGGDDWRPDRALRERDKDQGSVKPKISGPTVGLAQQRHEVTWDLARRLHVDRPLNRTKLRTTAP